MKNKKTIFLLFTIILCSCTYFDNSKKTIIKGSESLLEDVFSVSSIIDELIISDVVFANSLLPKIEITKSNLLDENTFSIKSDDNIIDCIQSSFENGILKISGSNSICLKPTFFSILINCSAVKNFSISNSSFTIDSKNETTAENIYISSSNIRFTELNGETAYISIADSARVSFGGIFLNNTFDLIMDSKSYLAISALETPYVHLSANNGSTISVNGFCTSLFLNLSSSLFNESFILQSDSTIATLDNRSSAIIYSANVLDISLKKHSICEWHGSKNAKLDYSIESQSSLITILE